MRRIAGPYFALPRVNLYIAALNAPSTVMVNA